MNIIDIVILAVVILVVVLSAKKGFVSSCLDTVSVAISVLASYKLCTPLANSMYDMFIKDLVKTEFRRALDEMSSFASVKEKVAGMIASLPETAVKLASSMGVDVNNIQVSLSGGSDDALIETMADTFAYNIMITLTEIIVFVVLFILFSLLVRFISKFFSKNLEKLPVVGKVDTILGGVLGLVKALVIVFAGSVLLYIIAQTAEPGSPLESVESSKIYMFMNEHNPIIQILKG